jgi:hypothetical protein
VAYYEFGSLEFKPRVSESQPLVSPGEVNYSLRHIPYSNANVLHIGGRNADTYGPIEIRLTPAQVAGFLAKLEDTDELIVAGVTYPSATLVQLNNKVTDPHGTHVWFTALWVIG